MAKIQSFRVPFTVKRDASGNVLLELDETKKTEKEGSEVNVKDGSELLKKATEVSQFNDKEMLMARNTLLPKQQEGSGFIIQKIITE